MKTYQEGSYPSGNINPDALFLLQVTLVISYHNYMEAIDSEDKKKRKKDKRRKEEELLGFFSLWLKDLSLVGPKVQKLVNSS